MTDWIWKKYESKLNSEKGYKLVSKSGSRTISDSAEVDKYKYDIRTDVWFEYKGTIYYVTRLNRDEYGSFTNNYINFGYSKTLIPASSSGESIVTGYKEISGYGNFSIYNESEIDKYYDKIIDDFWLEYKGTFYLVSRRETSGIPGDSNHKATVYYSKKLVPATITIYSKGSYIGEVVADYNAYTNDKRNKDGYWYVRDREANVAPTLLGNFGDLGSQNNPFTVSFQADDQDQGQSLKAIIRLNGTQIKVFENMTRRQVYEVKITEALLKDLEFNKKNTINISLTDGSVSVEENFYFTKTNRAPIINVTHENMGLQNKEFSFTFKASDPDGDSMTGKIYIDGVQVEDLGPIIDGKDNSYSIKREDFIVLKNGEHKIRIDVTDSEGSQSSSFITFNKMVTWYLYEYTEELAAKPVDVRVDMLANISEGAVKKVEVSNNVKDASPAWEVIEDGKWYKFKNGTKTATNWGLGVRVRIDRGEAKADSYIYGFNISYA